MPTENLQLLCKQLTEIKKDIDQYCAFDNKNGFYRKFVFWVIKTWGKAYYYETKVINSGYDVSCYPKSTSFQLKDKVMKYADFINANTGQTEVTNNSGAGIICETFESELYNVFSDTCLEFVEQEITVRNLILPEEYSNSYDSLSELIFSGDIDYDKHPDFYDICDAIQSEYGLLGYKISPYLCEISSFEEAKGVWKNHPLANLTLSDFKNMALVSTKA